MNFLQRLFGRRNTGHRRATNNAASGGNTYITYVENTPLHTDTNYDGNIPAGDFITPFDLSGADEIEPGDNNNSDSDSTRSDSDDSSAAWQDASFSEDTGSSFDDSSSDSDSSSSDSGSSGSD